MSAPSSSAPPANAGNSSSNSNSNSTGNHNASSNMSSTLGHGSHGHSSTNSRHAALPAAGEQGHAHDHHDDYEDDYDYDYDDEEEGDYESDEYDSHEERANYYDRKLEIEQSWLEWEQSIAIKNRSQDQRRRQQEQLLLNFLSKSGGANGGPLSGASMPARSNGAAAAVGAENGGLGSTVSPPSPSSSSSITAAAAARSRAGPRTPAEAAAIEHLRSLRGAGRTSAAAIVDSYSALSWEEKRRARRERLAAKHMDYEPGENLICLMPIELLTHMFSYMEPSDLVNVALVCPLFYHVVNADSCWKMAFDKFFGCQAPFNRLDTRSWRAEYCRRTQLLRKWDRGRGRNLMYDPKIGIIKKIWMEDSGPAQGWLLVGSLEHGIVARCDPQRGRVHRDILYPSHHMQTRTVTALDFDRHRVFWGLAEGDVALTRLSKSATDRMFQVMRGAHAHPVNCVKLLPLNVGVVLSADTTGIIKAWDTRKQLAVCYFTALPPPDALELREKIVMLECNPKTHLIAGTESGRLYIWELDITTLVDPPADGATPPPPMAPPAAFVTVQQHTIPPRRIDLPLRGKRIQYLQTHFEDGAGMLLVRQEEATVVQIYNIFTLDLVGVLQSPAHYTAITACAWDPPRVQAKPMIPSVSAKISHEPGLFVTGDSVGNICTWTLPWELVTRPPGYAGEWRLGYVPKSPEEALLLRPSGVLKGHDAEISCLFIDRALVVSGCLQGKVKAWNPVNSELIRIIHTTRLSHPAAIKAVTCITINSQKCHGAVAIGGLIKSWDYSGDIAINAKDKHRKFTPKRSSQTSVLQRRKVQYDIKQSLEETISLKRLEDQARERREQLHRRYNLLEKHNSGSDANPMTEEELLEYVMMVSRDHQVTLDERAIARQMARIHAMEKAPSLRSPTLTRGRSPLAPSATEAPTEMASSEESHKTTSPEEATTVSPSHLDSVDDEEEELVRRAIEMSMADTGEQSSNMHDEQVARFLNSPESPKQNLQEAQPIDVDNLPAISEMAQEDQAIVREILKELELEEAERQAQEEKAMKEQREEWPTLSSGVVGSIYPSTSLKAVAVKDVQDGGEASSTTSSSSFTASVATATTESPAPAPAEPPAKKSWSMVAKSSLPQTSATSVSTLRAIQAAMEEDEDEDAQLARILSLSMVEK
ncbi:hypothetical protein BGZ73_006789 [Actinomortierella ambigua]|nr:hypothetical protein BGZ73_006789 [Actinomortierella ambigua]